MGREERKNLIDALQRERGGNRVIAYVTSTRPNLEVQMAMDVIPLFYNHLSAIETPPSETKIDLFIHSNGGDGVVPWKLMTLMREFCSELNVLVPNRAFSAATLTALGADEVLMHPMGMLGPTDPTVTNEFNPPNERAPGQLLGISVEDVRSYIELVKEDVGIGHEDELVQAFIALANKVHPLALGNVKRSTSQSRMMGEKLLRSRKRTDLEAHEITQIITQLTSQLYYHGHPINRSEARDDLGLTFVKDPTPAVEKAMWSLFEAYAQDMRLNEAFQFIQEAISVDGVPDVPSVSGPMVPGMPIPGGGITVKNTVLPVMKNAYIESMPRCDVMESGFEVTVRRDPTGRIDGNAALVRQSWTTE